jgi:hypothetical protein
MKYTELQRYFSERIVELFHKDTIDSYRVRSHNALSLLKELKELVSGWKDNRIKQFETVQLCIEENLDSLKFDTCLDYSFYDKNIFIRELETYSKTGEKNPNLSNRIITILNKCISLNENKYINNLFEKIEEKLFDEREYDEKEIIPVIKNLDNNISSLACEFINIGFSKIHLFVCASDFLSSDKPFKDTFDGFKYKFVDKKESNYKVIFKIHVPDNLLQGNEITDFVKELDPEYINEFTKHKFRKFIQSGTSIRFFVNEVTSCDNISAIKKSKEALSCLLDQLNLGMMNLSIDIPDTALIVTQKKGGPYIYQRGTQFILDGNYSDDLNKSHLFREYLNNINNNQNIKQEVKDRINSAIRHIRIANSSTELEQQFINYWIALEFIFSSPETNENTYTRLITNLTNILTCCYVKRNFYAINDELIKREIIDIGSHFWDKGIDIDNVIASLESPLLKYRLTKLKSLILDNGKDKRKAYVINHNKNVSRHITRIYRMRNELIHEAAIKQNIENVTSNLRYYLIFLLNNIIVFFAKIPFDSNELGLSDFFIKYDMLMKKIENGWDLDTLLSVPMENELLKQTSNKMTWKLRNSHGKQD